MGTPVIGLIGMLIAVATATAQPTPRPLAGLDRYVTATMPDWGIPGVAIAVVKDGAVVYAKGFGVLRAGDTARVTPETMFGIGSISKSFTAAALGLLVDEARIGWNDVVASRLPGFAMATPEATASTTIRDLLSHRTGLPGENVVFWGSDVPREEVVRRIRFLPLAYPPRTTFEYQNLAFVAAGEVIPAMTGTSWDDLVERRLFGPLGMTRSTTRVASLGRFTNVATPHAPRAGKTTPIPWLNLDNAGAAGSIVASARDMAAYIRLQLGGGAVDGKRLISDSVVRQMHAGSTIFPLESALGPAFADAHFIEYGLGWFRQDYHGFLIVSHGGQTDGMHANLALLPEKGLGVVVLTNSVVFGYPMAISYRIIDGYLGRAPRDWSREVKTRLAAFNRGPGARRAEDAGGGPSIASGRLVGRYHHDYLGEATVTLEGDRLFLSMLGRKVLLEHRGGDSYQPQWVDDLVRGTLPVATFEGAPGTEARRLKFRGWTLERRG